MAEKTEDMSRGMVLDTQVLWHLEFREDATFPWKEVGTHRSDPAEVLRTHDFWCKNHADVDVRLVKTLVQAEVADPEWLREVLAPKNPAEDTSVLESE